MIRPLNFPEALGANASAFDRYGKPRALRITLLCSPHESASTTEQAAVSLLRELSHLEDVDSADTEHGTAAHLTIGEYDNVREFLPVELKRTDSVTRWGIHGVEYWGRRLAALEQTGEGVSASTALFPVLPYLEAHLQGRRDLLVTTNPALIASASQFPKANIVTAADGCKIVGLYLRLMRNWVFSRGGGTREALDRHGFYWTLTRHRTPSMWRYMGACLMASRPNREEIAYLGNTVLVRLHRALQARDEIGFQFYQPQGNSTRELMLYHFDYLLMLLVGALDAQARIAHRVYQLTSQERRASFIDGGFRVQLESAGADGLSAEVSSDRFCAFREVLWSLRGTIHGAANWPLGVHEPGGLQRSLCRIGSRANEIWTAACLLGAPADLGIERLIDVEFEPYTCACALTNEALKYVDKIALETDVIRLFDAGSPVPDLPAGPPEKDEFRLAVRQRVDLLG